MAGTEIHTRRRVFQGNVVGIVHVDVGQKLLQPGERPGAPVVRYLFRIRPRVEALQKGPEGLDGGGHHVLVKRSFFAQLPGYGADQVLQTSGQSIALQLLPGNQRIGKARILKKGSQDRGVKNQKVQRIVHAVGIAVMDHAAFADSQIACMGRKGMVGDA